jgi:thiol:disulfide interchange protein
MPTDRPPRRPATPRRSSASRKPSGPLAVLTFAMLAALALVASPGVAPAQPSGFGGAGGFEFPGATRGDEKATDPLAPDFGGAAEISLSKAEIAPGGQLVAMITLRHGPGWKSWPSAEQNALPAGFEAMILTEVSTDPLEKTLFAAGPVQWPELAQAKVPAPDGSGAVDAMVMKGTVRIFVPIRVRNDAPLGDATIDLAFTFQSCDETVCDMPITEEFSESVTIAAVEPSAAVPAGAGEGFDLFDATVFQTEWQAAQAVLPAGADPASRATEQAEATTTAEAAASDELTFNDFGLGLTLDMSSFTGQALLLAIAFLGGFILNLTPCVLPVLPIKVMGLASGDKSRAKTLALGIVMSAGVISFFMVVGVLIAFAKVFDSTNELFGYWPFTFGIGAFIGVMGIAMLGAFTISLPQSVYRVNPSQDTPHGSFLFGVLTAILSLPCTAPFMGTAVAWATTPGVSPVLVLATFGAVGTGMALPYFVLSANPQWVSKIPRTGPASELVKQFMGLLMLAVAAFFIGTGIISLTAERPEFALSLHWWAVAMVLIIAAVWLTARTLSIAKSPAPKIVFPALGALVALGGVLWAGRMTSINADMYEIAAEQDTAEAARLAELESLVSDLRAALEAGATGLDPALAQRFEALEDASSGLWQRYESGPFEAARARGDVVVLDFTAEWCINCKVLKATVLSTDRVKTALDQEGVSSFLADITSGKAPGREQLKALGERTIPLLVVWGPGLDKPWKANAYTPDEVVNVIERAKGAPAESTSETALR